MEQDDGYTDAGSEFFSVSINVCTTSNMLSNNNNNDDDKLL